MRLKHYIFTEKLTPNLEKKSKRKNLENPKREKQET
jgi:hypothetical protein